MHKFYIDIAKNKQKIGLHPDFKGYFIFYCKKYEIGFIDFDFDDKSIEEHYKSEYRETRNEILNSNYLVTQKIRANSQFSFILKYSKITYFENVLDIGTSSGALLSEFVTTSNLYGFEPDINMFNFAKKNLPKANLYNDVFNINLLPNQIKFDLITLSHVFEHLTDPISKLQSYLELLNDNGLLFIEVPYDNKRLIDQIINTKVLGIYHTYFYQPKSLMKIVEDVGGNVVSLKEYGYRHNDFNYCFKKKSLIQKVKEKFKINQRDKNYYNIFNKEKNKGTWIRILIKK